MQPHHSTPTSCSSTPQQTVQLPATTRFHLRAPSGLYARAGALGTQMITANSQKTTYWETYAAVPAPGGYVALLNEATQQYLSADGTNGGLTASRGSPSDWELYKIVAQPNNKYAIQAKKNNQYVTVQPDTTLAPTSTTVVAGSLFDLVVPSGGSL